MMIDDAADFRRVLTECRVIAVVGVSPKSDRPSHYCSQYLLDHGYTVIPVNPELTEVLGLVCYPDLASIPTRVDMVNVFRKPADVPPVAAEAVRIGARCLWLQLGVIHEAAAAMACTAGLDVVMDHCVKMTHARCFPTQAG